MRSEKEMYALILRIANADERIRAVLLNGSRANPNATRDPFQDFDIVYLVTETDSFRNDPEWHRQFGKLMILQRPNEMQNPPPENGEGYAYLMQFMDGNRIDLTLYPIEKFNPSRADSLSAVLLDKDGRIPPLPPPSEKDYLPRPPTAKDFEDCCNEFWWVCPYVAKGLWRREILYAKHILDGAARTQLLRMLEWYIGIQTEFSVPIGKFGKHLDRSLEADLWNLLLETYSDSDYEATWDALFAMTALFRKAALPVEKHFGFDYPRREDKNVTAYLKRIRRLPRDDVD